MGLTPYYDDAGVTLYLGDCREILPMLSKGSADLLVTDPPYGVGYQSGHRTVAFPLIAGDNTQEVAIEGISAALPVLRAKRHLYVFGRYDALSRLNVPRWVELIWDKVSLTGGDLQLPWARSHEYIQFGVSVGSKAKRDSGEGVLSTRLRSGSVLRHARPNATRHPTEKPVALLRELIESSSRFGEVVLDPFFGVGSTGEAAMREERKCIGIELDERYCEIAAKRLSLLAQNGARL